MSSTVGAISVSVFSGKFRPRLMEPGGNSGVFAWSNAEPDPATRLPNGVEIQMLELEWPNLHKVNEYSPDHQPFMKPAAEAEAGAARAVG